MRASCGEAAGLVTRSRFNERSMSARMHCTARLDSSLEPFASIRCFAASSVLRTGKERIRFASSGASRASHGLARTDRARERARWSTPNPRDPKLLRDCRIRGGTRTKSASVRDEAVAVAGGSATEPSAGKNDGIVGSVVDHSLHLVLARRQRVVFVNGDCGHQLRQTLLCFAVQTAAVIVAL